MEISRFKKILRHSTDNRSQTEEQVREFYSQVEMEPDRMILNFMQIGRSFFSRRNFMVVEMPFPNQETGALCYRGDAQGYVFLNTSLPKVDANFAMCHEIGHILLRKTEREEKAQWYLNGYACEREEELSADFFAGAVMMPERLFSSMFNRFENERRDGERALSVLVKLMNYFQAPYMAVLIRCCELKLLEAGDVLKELLAADPAAVRSEFYDQWLDEILLEPTRKDDFARLFAYARHMSELCKKEGYLGERRADRALENMQALYDQIREAS